MSGSPHPVPERQSRFLNQDQYPLEEAQQRLLALWKDRPLVSRRVLAYDTTNYYTFIASTNERNTLAQRGHPNQAMLGIRSRLPPSDGKDNQASRDDSRFTAEPRRP
ncbi:MAG: hypothetical protein Q8N47_05360 [Bryobacterales bacterium]|nr:hypothetical protein [Bryobacterales bacterium]